MSVACRTSPSEFHSLIGDSKLDILRIRLSQVGKVICVVPLGPHTGSGAVRPGGISHPVINRSGKPTMWLNGGG